MKLQVEVRKRFPVEPEAAVVISANFLEWLDHNGHIKKLLSPAGPSYVELADMFIKSVTDHDVLPIDISVID